MGIVGQIWNFLPTRVYNQIKCTQTRIQMSGMSV
jgi:hypothetical protein